MPRRSPDDATPTAPKRRSDHHEVLVIGAGPAGSSCAYWLADAGWDVAVVERKRFPREKTCGDGLTPRAVRQLADMGVEGALTEAHRYTGLRSCGFGMTLELDWPQHPGFPSYGYTITRHDLDQLVAERAVKAGATLWQGTEAVEPLLDEATDMSAALPRPTAGGTELEGPDTWGRLPRCHGALVKDKATGQTREVRADYVVVADGSTSRFGWALGTGRRRQEPLGMALRGYYRSPRHDDPFIESHLDIRTPEGAVVPGYGWIFPLGDGRVNVGVGLLSTDRRWKGVNTTKLMETFVGFAPKSWGIEPATACGPPTGGKLPMGMSVGPHAGPNVLVVGDAGGSINPFNGEGIAYGYETGRLGAAAIGSALTGGGPEALYDYERQLEDAYGPYYRVGRAFVRLISDPTVMRTCVSIGMHSEAFMAQLLRIMANLMRPDVAGPAEVGFRMLEGISHLLPDGTISALAARAGELATQPARGAAPGPPSGGSGALSGTRLVH